jgi:NADPH-dependent ferric siderophore reductase
VLSVGAPFAAAGDDVPGALPAGVYVAVCDDGRELALVRLEADGQARWMSEDDQGWHIGASGEQAPAALRDALRASEQSSMWLAGEIAARQAWGISPFGGSDA